jgi:hypothetical protein
LYQLPAFRRDKRHNGDGTRSLYGDCQFSLMIGTISSNSSGHDFSTLRDEVVENDRVFVINFNVGVRAEPADLPAVVDLPVAGPSVPAARASRIPAARTARPSISAVKRSLFFPLEVF